MKRNLRSKSTKKVLLLVLIIALIAAAIFFAFRYIQTRQQNNNAMAPGSSSKQDIIDGDTAASENGEGLPDDSTSITTDEVPIDPQLSTTISSFSQSDGMVTASAATSGSGTCVFLFRPSDNGKPVSRQVEVANQTCSTAISQNEFALLGDWTLTVTYYNSGKKAEASQNVTIN